MLLTLSLLLVSVVAAPPVPTQCRVSYRQFSVVGSTVKAALFECDFDQEIYVANFSDAPQLTPYPWADLNNNKVMPSDGHSGSIAYHVTTYFAGHVGLTCGSKSLISAPLSSDGPPLGLTMLQPVRDPISPFLEAWGAAPVQQPKINNAVSFFALTGFGESGQQQQTPITEEELDACNGGEITFDSALGNAGAGVFTNAAGEVVADRQVAAEKWVPECTQEDVQSLQSGPGGYQWVMEAYTNATSKDEFEAISFSSGAFAASSAFTGCLHLLNSFYNATTSTKVLPPTTACHHVEGTTEWQNDPCCNNLLLQWQCCAAKPVTVNVITVGDVNSASIGSTCAADATDVVEDLLKLFLDDQSGADQCTSRYAIDQDTIWNDLGQFKDECWTKVDARWRGGTCKTDSDCPYTPGCNTEDGKCFMDVAQRGSYLSRCFLDSMDPTLMQHFKKQLGLSQTAGEAEITATIQSDLVAPDCVGSDTQPWIVLPGQTKPECDARSAKYWEQVTYPAATVKMTWQQRNAWRQANRPAYFDQQMGTEWVDLGNGNGMCKAEQYFLYYLGAAGNDIRHKPMHLVNGVGGLLHTLLSGDDATNVPNFWKSPSVHIAMLAQENAHWHDPTTGEWHSGVNVGNASLCVAKSNCNWNGGVSEEAQCVSEPGFGGDGTKFCRFGDENWGYERSEPSSCFYDNIHDASTCANLGSGSSAAGTSPAWSCGKHGGCRCVVNSTGFNPTLDQCLPGYDAAAAAETYKTNDEIRARSQSFCYDPSITNASLCQSSNDNTIYLNRHWSVEKAGFDGASIAAGGVCTVESEWNSTTSTGTDFHPYGSNGLVGSRDACVGRGYTWKYGLVYRRGRFNTQAACEEGECNVDPWRNRDAASCAAVELCSNGGHEVRCDGCRSESGHEGGVCVNTLATNANACDDAKAGGIRTDWDAANVGCRTHSAIGSVSSDGSKTRWVDLHSNKSACEALAGHVHYDCGSQSEGQCGSGPWQKYLQCSFAPRGVTCPDANACKAAGECSDWGLENHGHGNVGACVVSFNITTVEDGPAYMDCNQIQQLPGFSDLYKLDWFESGCIARNKPDNVSSYLNEAACTSLGEQFNLNTAWRKRARSKAQCLDSGVCTGPRGQWQRLMGFGTEESCEACTKPGEGNRAERVNRWRSTHHWRGGTWQAAAMKGGAWTDRAMVPRNQWLDVINISKLDHLIDEAIGSIVGGSFQNRDVCQYGPVLPVLGKIACACGTNSKSGCFSSGLVQPGPTKLAFAGSTTELETNNAKVWVTPTGGDADVTVSTVTLFSNDSYSVGGQNQKVYPTNQPTAYPTPTTRRLNHIRQLTSAGTASCSDEIALTTGEKVGQFVGSGVQVSVSGAGTGGVITYLCVTPSATTICNETYPVPDFASMVSNVLTPLHTTVAIVNDQFCANFTSTGEYFPVRRTAAWTTSAPTKAPSKAPTKAPSKAPTTAPTAPTTAPTTATAPTAYPTPVPTATPTYAADKVVRQTFTLAGTTCSELPAKVLYHYRSALAGTFGVAVDKIHLKCVVTFSRRTRRLLAGTSATLESEIVVPDDGSTTRNALEAKARTLAADTTQQQALMTAWKQSVQADTSGDIPTSSKTAVAGLSASNLTVAPPEKVGSSSGLSNAAIGGIVGGGIALVLLIAFVSSQYLCNKKVLAVENHKKANPGNAQEARGGGMSP